MSPHLMRLFRLCGWLLPAFLAYVPMAHAYLDPGTGSMILQGIIGTVAVGLVAIRMYWAKVKQFFAGRPAPETRDEPLRDQ